MSEAMAPGLTTSRRFDFDLLACVLGLVVSTAEEHHLACPFVAICKDTMTAVPAIHV